MNSAIIEFDKAIASVKELDAIYNHLSSCLHIKDAAIEILRSQIVNSVSAMDRYFHEVVRLGFLEEYHGIRKKTDSFKKWNFSCEKIAEIIKYSSPSYMPLSVTETVDYVVSTDIQEKNGYLAFQQPSKINDALSIIWTESQKMIKIAHQMSFEPEKNDNDRKKNLEQKIKIISIRRNQIVHEGDIDSVLSSRRSVCKTISDDYIDFINNFVHAVHVLITDRSCYTIP